MSLESSISLPHALERRLTRRAQRCYRFEMLCLRGSALLFGTAALLSCGARSELATSVTPTSGHDAGSVTPEDSASRVVPIRLFAHADAHFALMSDGTVRIWGHSSIPGLIDPRRATEVPGVQDIVAIRGEAMAFDYITRAGELYRVSERGTSLPGARVPGLPLLRDSDHSGGSVMHAWLSLDGRAYSRRQFDSDEVAEVTSPVRFRSIGGLGRGLAAGANGRLYSWGRVGDFVATPVDAPFSVRAVWGECVLSERGELACRGEGFGPDGIPWRDAFTAEFARVSSVTDIVDFTLYLNSLIMLRGDGTLMIAGFAGPRGCLSNPMASLAVPNPPLVVVGIRDVSGFSNTQGSFCVLLRTREVACCGVVQGGSLGDGRTQSSDDWVPVAFE